MHTLSLTTTLCTKIIMEIDSAGFIGAGLALPLLKAVPCVHVIVIDNLND